MFWVILVINRCLVKLPTMDKGRPTAPILIVLSTILYIVSFHIYHDSPHQSFNRIFKIPGYIQNHFCFNQSVHLIKECIFYIPN